MIDGEVVRYGPAALRRSLETRLQSHAAASPSPLDRLRKEATLQRLLARLAQVAPPDGWALKGGLLMVARVGQHARATADADITWRAGPAELTRAVEQAAEVDVGDHFGFLVGEPRRLPAEVSEAGLRFPVIARLAGRTFDRVRLDVNIVADDPRPVEKVSLRNLFDFAGLEPVTVPAVTPAQQLAEKLHAYVRRYGIRGDRYTTRESSRAKDLYDMLVIAEHVPLPPLGRLAATCRQTFAMRQTPWPPALNPPPALWESAWRGFVADYRIRFRDLDDAYLALDDFWMPPLAGAAADARWTPRSWRWIEHPSHSRHRSNRPRSQHLGHPRR